MWKNKLVEISRPASETITEAEDSPSLVTDGIACASYRNVAVTFTGLTATDIDIQVWVNDTTGWAQATDAAGAVIDIDDITTTWGQTFEVAGFDRFAVVVDGGTGFGEVVRQYSLSRF